MRKFTKLLLFSAVEFIIMAAFLNLSEISKLASSVLFPPIFAITLYFFVVIAFDVERQGIKRIDFVFALLLASVALISSGAGFHYAANDINDVFLKESGLSAHLPEAILDRIYYLDENFSHAILLVGFLGIVISTILWWYLRRYNLPTMSEELAGSTFDQFIIIFIGSLLGGISSFLSIEAQIVNYVISILAIFSVLFVLKFRKNKITIEGRDFIMFILTYIAAFFAISVVYYLMSWTNAVTFL